MSALLALVPLPYRILAIVALVAATVAGLFAAKHHYDEGKRAEGAAVVRAEWAADREKQKDAALRQAAANAQETARRLAEQRKAQETHDAQLAQAQRDAAAARNAALGLSRELASFTAAARRATGNPAAVGDGAATGDPIGVLADVLGRADARAGILADVADRARIAGEQCVREYEALTPP